MGSMGLNPAGRHSAEMRKIRWAGAFWFWANSLLPAMVHGPSEFGDMGIRLTPPFPSDLSPPPGPHQAPNESEKSLPWWLHLQEGVGVGAGAGENSS